MRFKVTMLFCLGFFLYFGAFAQTEKLIQITMDHASFSYDEQQVAFEVYLGFEATSIPFEVNNGKFEAHLPIMVELIRSGTTNLSEATEEPIFSDAMQLGFAVSDTTSLIQGQSFVHLIRQLVPPGEYDCIVTLLPDASRNITEQKLQKQVILKNLGDTTKPILSDIALASTLERTDDTSDSYYRSGLSVQPNPNQLFGSNLNRVYYYAEAYHMDKLKESGAENYTSLIYIAEANLPQPLPNFQKRTQRTIRDTDVLVGGFDISTLPSGSYFLRIAVLNENNEALAEQYKKFFVYNPDVVVESEILDPEEEFKRSIYANMPEDEVELALKHIDVIATDQEKKRIKQQRNLEAKRRFLAEFWKIRDPNPQSLVNETQNDFYDRLRMVNERYANSFKEGWQTDRGRAILKYGNPSSIEPHLYERDSVPYEVWQYNNIPGEGQAFMVFADVGGFGEMEMIHSSVLGERKSVNWQSEVRK